MDNSFSIYVNYKEYNTCHISFYDYIDIIIYEGGSEMNITTRPLTTEEAVLLILKSKTPWKEIFFLALYTGLRISDLCKLPYNECPDSIVIEETKTKKLKPIMFTELAQGYWNSLYRYGEKRVFLFPFQDPSTYRKSVQNHCKKIGIDTYRIAFHSFRKTHAVIAFRDGGLLEAKATMNHSSIRVTEKYIETALKFDCGKVYDKIFLPGTKHIQEEK